LTHRYAATNAGGRKKRQIKYLCQSQINIRRKIIIGSMAIMTNIIGYEEERKYHAC
jgi:hypothetical protein